jgi:hypothetical protein
LTSDNVILHALISSLFWRIHSHANIPAGGTVLKTFDNRYSISRDNVQRNTTCTHLVFVLEDTLTREYPAAGTVLKTFDLFVIYSLISDLCSPSALLLLSFCSPSALVRHALWRAGAASLRGTPSVSSRRAPRRAPPSASSARTSSSPSCTGRSRAPCVPPTRATSASSGAGRPSRPAAR